MATASVEVPNIELIEYLTTDLRPSIFVDLQPPHRILFKNSRFTSKYDFEDRGAGRHDLEQDAFRSWAFSDPGWESGASINYCGSTWVATTLRGRWRIIQSTTVSSRTSQADASLDERRGSRASLNKTTSARSVEEHDAQLRYFQEGARNHDWTASVPPDDLSPHVQLLRSWDWSKTPLGDMDTWPPLLVSMANILMVDPRPVGQKQRSFSIVY
jgi:hypothetical protein